MKWFDFDVDKYVAKLREKIVAEIMGGKYDAMTAELMRQKVALSETERDGVRVIKLTYGGHDAGEHVMGDVDR